ncbi:MAG: glycosyltransferase family 39 protein [Anaerolineae bacterium]|nr:glycosyltransferase family 39 protein [Anaerolineae bacterium]
MGDSEMRKANIKQALRKSVILLPALFLFVLILIPAIQGVDFGTHWDEYYTIWMAKQYVRTANLLPGWYEYPSMISYFALLTNGPYAIPHIVRQGFEWKALSGHLMSVMQDNPTFHLNVRKVVATVASLAVVWIYLTNVAWKRRWVEALLAAALLGLSWEFNYHSRWIATDAVMTQFGAMTLMFCMLMVLYPQYRKYLWPAGAIAAGWATGTKYPGAIFVLPVLVAAFVSRDRGKGFMDWAPTLLGVCFVFGSAYLVVTPGTVLDPLEFYQDTSGQFRHYQTGHGFQSVVPGVQSLWAFLIYYSRVFFSHYQPIALFFFVFTLVGLYSLYTESRSLLAVFLTFPVVYLLYFSTQKVLFVRNLLSVTPFLAILAARGIAYSIERIKPRTVKFAFGGLISALLVVNAAWLYYAAGTIQDSGTDRFVREFTSYAEENAELTFLVSEKLANDIAKVAGEIPGNVTTDNSQDIDMVAAYYSEATIVPGHWDANRPDIGPDWFGPFDVNMDYYAHWLGNDRILYMSFEKAKQIKVLLLDE